MYLEEIPKYRDTIVEQFIKSEKIVSLLGSDDDGNEEPSGLVYKYIFPFDHIVDKTTTAGNYICFDIVAPRVVSRAFVDFRIYIWIISHDRWMQTPQGLSTDLLSIEIERIMNGSKNFGLGTVELTNWDRFVPADGFHGRMLVYRTVDFNRE